MKTHLPCPECGSSDALTDYGDHSYCFSCGFHSGSGPPEEVTGNLLPLESLSYSSLRRGISREICRRYSYGVTSRLHIASYYHGGQLLYQKTRDAEKNFSVLKAEAPNVPLKDLLFGRHIWGDSGGQKLLICEGEIDTLSGAEALLACGFHVVGIPCGAQGALDTLRANISWIERYAEVYLGFDNDPPGREAATSCCKALGDNRWFLLNIPPETKDLNELLQSGGTKAVLEAYHNAHQWRPEGIIDPKDFLRITQDLPSRGIDWPWPTLNETTYGIIPGLTLLAAGSGVGKTTWFKQVEAHVFTLGHKIGVIHLEESAANTINGLCTLLTGYPFHVPGATVPDDIRRSTVDNLSQSGRFILYDKAIGFDEGLILGTIKYMRKGLGADVVFLDHLTAITDQYDRDVNQRTRNLIVNLGKLTTSLDLPLICISHLRKSDGKPHEEGGRVHLDDLLGSGAIKQWAMHVFALERDNQAENPADRNKPVLRDLKNRPLGEHTGSTLVLEYNHKTFTLEEPHGLKNLRKARPKATTDF